MVETIVILVIVLVIVVVGVGAALMMRKQKSYCPQCGNQWREGAMACMSCKFSPYLPPAHVSIDNSPSDNGPLRPPQPSFEGDARDPWVRRNF